MRQIKFRAWDGCGKYLAGDDGNVYSTNFNHTGKTKSLKGDFDKDGYHHVLMNIDGKRIYVRTHKIIALAFHGPKPTEKHQVNHKNGIRTDNRPSNLEYVTSRENTIHGWRSNGRKHTKEQINRAREQFSGTNNPKAKINEAMVLSIRRLRVKGVSLREISDRHGISVAQVSAIANNKFWKNAIQSTN